MCKEMRKYGAYTWWWWGAINWNYPWGGPDVETTRQRL